GQFSHLAVKLNVRLRQESFGLGTIKSRMHACQIFQSFRNSQPTRQYRHIGDETNIAHELITLCPGIPSEHSQLPLVGDQAEDRIQCGGLAGTVRADEAENTAFLNPQIHSVKGDRRSECFPETMRFNACHEISAPLPCRPASMAFPMRLPSTGGFH